MKIVLTIALMAYGMAYGQSISKTKPAYYLGRTATSTVPFWSAVPSFVDSVRIIGNELYEFRAGVRTLAGVLPTAAAPGGSTMYVMLPAGTSATWSGKAGDPVIVKAISGTLPTVTPNVVTNGTGTNATVDVTGITTQINTQASQLATLNALLQAQAAEIARLKADSTTIFIGPKLKYENKVLDLR